MNLPKKRCTKKRKKKIGLKVIKCAELYYIFWKMSLEGLSYFKSFLWITTLLINTIATNFLLVSILIAGKYIGKSILVVIITYNYVVINQQEQS